MSDTQIRTSNPNKEATEAAPANGEQQALSLGIRHPPQTIPKASLADPIRVRPETL